MRFVGAGGFNDGFLVKVCLDHLEVIIIRERFVLSEADAGNAAEPR
jgi:hypothetical protein